MGLILERPKESVFGSLVFGKKFGLTLLGPSTLLAIAGEETQRSRAFIALQT